MALDSTKCSYSGELKVVLTTVPTASKLLIKFSINVLTLSHNIALWNRADGVARNNVF